MSTLMLSACWRLKIGPTEKLVLISLADQANDDGVCWPGVGSIARRTCLSERSVQRAIGDLESRRMLYRVPRPGTSTVYRLTPPPSEGGDTLTPRRADTLGVPDSHPGGDAPSPTGRQPDTQSVSEPSMNRQGTTAGPAGKLPGFIPAEPWADFEKMRKAKRAPLTDRARVLMWRRLDKLRAAGEDLEAVLEQSILHSWSNVFAIKGENHAGKTEPKHSVGRALGRAFVAEHGGSR